MAQETAPFTDAALDGLVEDLNRDGICVLRGALDRALIEEWSRAFDALFRERQERPGGLAPRERNRYYLTLPWVAPFADPVAFANPAVLGVLDRLFPQEYVQVQFGADVPVSGSDYQETHRDFRPLFTDQVVTPLYAVAVNFPLVDVTEENGPLQHARGTHLLPREAGLAKIASGEIPLESFPMSRGDVAIRSPLALHRGTPNRSARPRPMMVMGYVMHWLHTPQVDVNIPRDFYQSLPEPVRKRLRGNVVERIEEQAETYVNFKF
jgi:ectoine hydroxylase-related dioxygenase (phytanoyl-CoA dioxygenase family)